MFPRFPGMNPYLEQPAFWSAFHTRILVAIADTLAPNLLPTYYIEVETRTYQEQGKTGDDLLVGIADVGVIGTNTPPKIAEDLLRDTSSVLTQKRPQPITLPMSLTVKHRYLAVREVGNNQVITIIEVLSPKNKQKGQGRTAYERKRGDIFASQTNLIEIDLLRQHPPMTILGEIEATDYRIIVSRSWQRPQADLYGFNLPEPIPTFPLPLKPEDSEQPVHLQTIVDGVCERAGYHQRINYQQPLPPPKLSVHNQKWIDELLSSSGGNSPEV
ncbi:DUF4058 family protein [Calothrix sp. 336/3]|uniref:DUF4058 family protein n=1 Tax=Calothrix sp. 336/3 TaxID=1337936 RepID=UPI000559337C|nr:DUF4058 family protein [Calothrix sp. 336/3]AKG24086.1 hypothetical protein IJ00_24695 [Calothrix sp. 336/3]